MDAKRLRALWRTTQFLIGSGAATLIALYFCNLSTLAQNVSAPPPMESPVPQWVVAVVTSIAGSGGMAAYLDFRRSNREIDAASAAARDEQFMQAAGRELEFYDGVRVFMAQQNQALIDNLNQQLADERKQKEELRQQLLESARELAVKNDLLFEYEKRGCKEGD